MTEIEILRQDIFTAFLQSDASIRAFCTEPVVRLLAKHVLEFLDYIHTLPAGGPLKAAIAHKDIKHENTLVFTDAHGQLIFKVFDFGLSCFIGDEIKKTTGSGAFRPAELHGHHDSQSLTMSHEQDVRAELLGLATLTSGPADLQPGLPPVRCCLQPFSHAEQIFF